MGTAVINIPGQYLAQIREVAGAHPSVSRVLLYGSRARGDALERSDVDLAVEAPEIPRAEWSDIWYTLTEDAETLLHVDLVLMSEAPQNLREHILRDGIVIYDRGAGGTQPG